MAIQLIYFEWCEGCFGAMCSDSMVLLRAESNEYAALGTEASTFLCFILSSAFRNSEGVLLAYNMEAQNTEECPDVDNDKINQYIQYFLDQHLIGIANNKHRRNRIARPIEPIGLKVREWYSHCVGVRLDKSLFVKAFFMLHKVHSILKKSYMSGIINFLDTMSQSDSYHNPSLDDSLLMAKALDTACLFYPKKTLCLPYAATLAALHYKKHYKCEFIIGVQSLPFYAHAWVETNDTVINDNPDLKLRLAPILKINSEFGVM